VAYQNWFALPERPVSDARAPFVLPEYLKMVLSKNVMRNVARFGFCGHGLTCKTGLYGRSTNKSDFSCLHRSRGESKLPTASSFPSRTVKLASVPDYSTASSELVSEGLERKRMKDSKLV